MKKIGKLILMKKEDYDTLLYAKETFENRANRYADEIMKNNKKNSEKMEEIEALHQTRINELTTAYEDLKQENVELKRSNAGYKSYMAVLKKDKKALEEKIKELNSDRYLRRRVPDDKAQSQIKAKVKSNAVQSNLVRQAHNY